MKYIISKEVFDKITQVITNMPYIQVANLINEIQKDIKPYECNCKKEKKEGYKNE